MADLNPNFLYIPLTIISVTIAARASSDSNFKVAAIQSRSCHIHPALPTAALQIQSVQCTLLQLRVLGVFHDVFLAASIDEDMNGGPCGSAG